MKYSWFIGLNLAASSTTPPPSMSGGFLKDARVSILGWVWSDPLADSHFALLN